MFPLKLKTKLVLAITGMVVALVTTLSSIYISQLIKQRIDEAYQNGEFVASEVFQSTREALESDLSNGKLDLSDPKVLQAATEESLQTDAGLNSLLQSIVGYSPTIYDVAVADASGKAIVHSDGNMTGNTLPAREHFLDIHDGGFWKQVRMVYGSPKVYDMQLPLQRDGQPFASVRVGISSVFLKESLQPKLNSAFLLSGIAILCSVLLAVGFSTLAFRPLAEISRKLDEMSAGAVVPQAANPDGAKGRDEYGVVNTKIDRLGKQMRDVKEVFSALKENLDQIMSNLQDGVMLFTRDEKAVLVSSSIETFLHKSRAELLGKTAHEIFDNDPRIGRIILDAFEQHQPLAQVEVLASGADNGGNGARVQLGLDFIEENGERIGALLTLRDAESVHRIEDELELSRRLAAVGRLTSGVAHEVKNPINAIVVHLEVLRQKLKDLDPDTRRHMDVIGTEIRRLDRVVQTLVDFTRPMELRLVEVDLRRLLEEITNLASPDAEKHGVHVLRNISDEPLPVKIDSDLVKQAVLNVMINGMQAMSHGGNLTISAQRVDGEAQVEITDQGGGIPHDIREKIFNLYFTTKSGGSGIGLPMTYRVMQLHNGAMEFDSVEGEGTTFRLHFPIAEISREVVTATSATSSTVER
ncbi:MAG: multi-sensor signal transduction histidine kinase [Acidobacteriales bacterium]|nr:multi-sensor signal transduction histidine kinase [Terriglobales bacterium]